MMLLTILLLLVDFFVFTAKINNAKNAVAHFSVLHFSRKTDDNLITEVFVIMELLESEQDLSINTLRNSKFFFHHLPHYYACILTQIFLSSGSQYCFFL